MTPNQEELRESFLHEFFEPTFVDLRPYDISFREERMIEWWLPKVHQASRLERVISEMGDEFQTLSCFSGKWSATSTRYLDPERVADYVARNVDCSGIVFGTVEAEGSTALEALENLSKKLNEK